MHFSGKEKRDGVEKSGGARFSWKRNGLETWDQDLPFQTLDSAGTAEPGGWGGLYTLSYKPKQIKN